MIAFAIIGWLFAFCLSVSLWSSDRQLERALQGWQRANERAQAATKEIDRQHQAWMKAVYLIAEFPEPVVRRIAEPSKN